MHSNLKEKLWAYIIENNPELMFSLQADYSVMTYLEDKISKVMPKVMSMLEQGKEGPTIIELAIHEMTEELRPSKFLYLKKILKEEFPPVFKKFVEAGVLTFETINLIEHCRELFETYKFSVDTEDNRLLRFAVVAKVHEYIN